MIINETTDPRLFKFTTIQDFPIADFRLHDFLQIRDGGTDNQLVWDYTQRLQNGVQLPPIKLARVGTGIFLYDGFHTFTARTKSDETTTHLTVELLDALDLTFDEVRYLAFAANNSHGKALKERERFQMFKAYIRANQHTRGTLHVLKTYSQIAKDLGKSKTTIFNWMKKYHPTIAARMTGDGLSHKSGGGLHKVKRDLATDFTDKAMSMLKDIALMTALDSEDGDKLRVKAIEMCQEIIEKLEATGARSPEANF
ncbi:MAG: helix-turn-helix domain-containing protein [Pseudomonadota bacterium]